MSSTSRYGVGTMLSSRDRRRVAQAIREAEARTQGDIVTVIARRSDDYAHVPLLWAALASLTVPGFAVLLVPGLPLGWAYVAQVGVFAALALLFRSPSVRPRLVPLTVRQQRAARHARELFFANDLHLAEGRAGVLIFVSAAERYVEILADSGIDAKVPQATWTQAVADFVAGMHRDDPAAGLVSVIGTVGDVLAEHFPAEGRDPNERPDRLIVL